MSDRTVWPKTAFISEPIFEYQKLELIKIKDNVKNIIITRN